MDDVFENMFLQNFTKYKSDLKIRPRKMWSRHSKPPKGAHPKSPLITPVSYVYSSFNTNSPNGPQRHYIKELGPRPNTTKVIDVMQSLQAQDFKMFNHDIRFNFMIGGDGVVYQGRGWRYRPKLPRRHLFNCDHSIYIGFIGYWHDEPPDQKLFELREELIKIGLYNGTISAKHSQVTLAYPSVYRFNFEAYIK